MLPRLETDVVLPRHAFGPRDSARAADIWRAFQELAVLASTANGWPPERYRQERCAFVVRSMAVLHHEEARYGESFRGETWVRRMRREMLSTREVRLSRGDEEPVASGTQEWVHVNGEMKPARGSRGLIDAFPPQESQGISLPKCDAFDAADESVFEFDTWHTWMDPLAHVNHPHYLEFAEEGLARALHERGIDVVALRAKAEEVTFLRGLVAGERVRVRTRMVGQSVLGLVSEHLIERQRDGALCARATLHREHPKIDLVAVYDEEPYAP